MFYCGVANSSAWLIVSDVCDPTGSSVNYLEHYLKMVSVSGLSLPLYPPTTDFLYQYPYQALHYTGSAEQLHTPWALNTLALNNLNYYNCLTSHNLMSSMCQFSFSNVRSSPKSRDSGISSDPALSPDRCNGSLDLSMKSKQSGICRHTICSDFFYSASGK
ncbi:hypothetical protein DPMN_127581 [Dreissena polymorpha]|uniref:Uncharacterized protein n=1 Tax=Dreissena polymorpha TaxID=45954 RepID=A0A9D4GZ75_DREPO|nr:hypothetical protein DPMN_127581 [Dreissena polymorpha]